MTEAEIKAQIRALQAQLRNAQKLLKQTQQATAKAKNRQLRNDAENWLVSQGITKTQARKLTAGKAPSTYKNWLTGRTRPRGLPSSNNLRKVVISAVRDYFTISTGYPDFGDAWKTAVEQYVGNVIAHFSEAEKLAVSKITEFRAEFPHASVYIESSGGGYTPFPTTAQFANYLKNEAIRKG